MPSSYKMQYSGQTIWSAWDVIALPQDLCHERTRSSAAMCLERGFGGAAWLSLCSFPKGVVQVQMALRLWQIQPVLPIQPTCLEKMGTHPPPSKRTASTGLTQGRREGGWVFMLSSLFWQVNMLISKGISCSGSVVSAPCSRHLAGTLRVLEDLWWPGETATGKLKGEALVLKCHR